MTRLQIVDIDEDAQLAVDFGLRIPLVRWDTGQVVAEGQIDRAMLLRRVLAGRLRRSLRDGAGTTKR